MRLMMTSMLQWMCRGGFIVYSIEVGNDTLSAADGIYTLDLAAPPHDYAQVRPQREERRRSYKGERETLYLGRL